MRSEGYSNGISPCLPKGELIDALSKLPVVMLKSIRSALFEDTKKMDFAFLPPS